jgi:hypothetical protein
MHLHTGQLFFRCFELCKFVFLKQKQTFSETQIQIQSYFLLQFVF